MVQSSQLNEVDNGGRTVMLIAELPLVRENPTGYISFLTGDDYNLSTSVGTYISSVVEELLILAENTV